MKSTFFRLIALLLIAVRYAPPIYVAVYFARRFDWQTAFAVVCGFMTLETIVKDASK